MAREDHVSVTSTERTSQDAGTAEHGEAVPAPKRRRVGLACSPCRLRKSRCDGMRPRCAQCERLGFECIYEVPDTSANLLVPREEKSLFASIENQIRVLENTVQHHEKRLANVETRNQEQSHTLDVNPELTESNDMSNSVVVNLEGLQNPQAGRSMTDGMAISFVGEQDCGFFGPSSNIALMRHIFRAMTKKSLITQDATTSPSSSCFDLNQANLIRTSRPPSPLSRHTNGPEFRQAIQTSVLPPDHETQKLLRCYFSNTGLLFPFIHEQSFLETYDRARENKFQKDVRRTWLGLLNMILAMATCTATSADESASDHIQESDVYFRRAQELCSSQILRGTTLEIVQYLLLMSQYLQGTQKSVQTWNTHGLAVKAALSIGLHSKDAMARFDPLEREIRKRTWFGCVLLDRSLSMTFGRPGMIPEEYIKLELPKPVSYLEGTTDVAQDTSIMFFNSTIRLYKLAWKVIGSLYGHNLGCEESPPEMQMVADILSLEQQLNDWRHDLPLPLFLRSASNLPSQESLQDQATERFRIILSLRCLNLQLLIYRPMLTTSLSKCSSSANKDGQRHGSLNHMHTTFNRTHNQVAEDIIEIVYTVLTNPGLGRDLIGAWWFTLYYTFNAALAIFGSLLVPIDGSGISCTELVRLDRGRSFLHKAVTGLGHLGRINIIVDRCIDYLKQLHLLVGRWAESSSRTLDLGLPGTVLDPFSTTRMRNETDIYPNTDLDMRPLGLDGGMLMFDELELGRYFATDFQWF